MFREMRKMERALSLEESKDILENASTGILAVHGDNDYPYAVPLNYAYDREHDKLYFHSTVESSHKIESIQKNPKVSFTVVSRDEVLPAKFSTNFQSVILFGQATVLTDIEEIQSAIMSIVKKYSGDYMERGQTYAQSDIHEYCIVEIAIEHLTGKARK